jgi:hypothetical protein
MNLDYIKRNWNKFWNIRNTFKYKGVLYLNDKDIPVRSEITNNVKCLEEITIKHWSYDDGELKAFKYFNDKYPKYKGKIWIL